MAVIGSGIVKAGIVIPPGWRVVGILSHGSRLPQVRPFHSNNREDVVILTDRSFNLVCDGPDDG